MQRLLRLLHPQARARALLPELLAVRLFSLLKMLKLGTLAAKRLFSFVLKPHPKTSPACRLLRVSSQFAAV